MGRLVLMVGAFVAVYAAVPAAEPRPVWTAASGRPVPNDFLVAMFPATGSVPVAALPGGAAVGTLDRAMVNSWEEIGRGGWVQMIEGDETRWVDLNSLGYRGGPDEAAQFAGFEAVFKRRGGQEFRAATLRFEANSAGVTVARLRLREDDEHWRDFVYEVRGTSVKPLEMYLMFGPGLALGDLGRVAAGVTASVGVLVVGTVGAVLGGRAKRKRLGRRGRRRDGHRTQHTAVDAPPREGVAGPWACADHGPVRRLLTRTSTTRSC